ncbi:MAG: tetratricopeptide repeat protein [Myxococcales bacterium]|nr:tetratricopeptide repeat protein [Myxococcales bacterium]
MRRLVADYLRVTTPSPLEDWRQALAALNELATGNAATQAEARRHLLASVEALLEAAESAPEGATAEDGRLLGQAASWLERLGRSSGVLSPLVVSRRLLEGWVLPLLPRDQAPRDWALAQNNLGNVLQVLGERRGDEEVLESSVAACRLALEVYTRTSAPLNWAATQNNLGNALRVLGERLGDEGMLEVSAAAYRSALEVYTRASAPVDWAGTQGNLGSLLQTLGGHLGDEGMLKASAVAYRSALGVFQEIGHDAYAQATQRSLERVLRLIEGLST